MSNESTESTATAADDGPVTWHRVTEVNDWEGETWYHYFEDGDGVLAALESAAERNPDLYEIDTLQLTWSAAEALANLESGYMDIHWFGQLIDFDGLALAAGEKDLYKGRIRKFGEELITYTELI